MNVQLKGTLVLVGCGKMGGAMLEGWLKTGMDAAHILVLEPKPAQEIVDLLASKGVGLNPAVETLKNVEVLVLAVKPQMMAVVLEELKPLKATKPLILSIAAGKTIATLEAAFGIRRQHCPLHAKHAGRHRPRHHRHGGQRQCIDLANETGRSVADFDRRSGSGIRRRL